jgi:integrating conjugative element protein (TIGR03759 family)
MAGEGRYHWPDTDPLTVLGIYAETDAERERYAEMIAKTEYRLQSKFIALNEAYVRAFNRLYGDQPMIALGKMMEQFRQSGLSDAVSPIAPRSSDTHLSIGDRYVLFVAPDCRQCRAYYTSIRAQQRPGAVLDIYIINTDKAGIVQWAKSVDIDPVLVSGGAITLNLGDEVWAQYERPALPAAFYYSVESGDIVPFSPE